MAQPLLLLVDDSADVALIVRHLCRKWDLEVAACPDGVQAFAFLDSRRPDLILLDMHLPGMNGDEVCCRLRATPAHAGLPVALLSHWQRPEDIAAGLRAGADFVVSKDLLCRPEDWRQRLGEILAVVGGQRPAFSLPWQEMGSEVRSLAEQFNRTTCAMIRARCGDEVLQILIARSVHQAQRCWPNGSAAPEAANHRWLTSDGLALNAEWLVRTTSPDAVLAFLTAFAEQSWRVLGTAAYGCDEQSLLTVAPAQYEHTATR